MCSNQTWRINAVYQNLDTPAQKSGKAVGTLSNVCMCLASALLVNCCVASGLIKVNRRTRSSGYTRQHLSEMILPARPIPVQQVKRDKRERGVLHVLSNLLKQTIRNHCTNVKAETVSNMALKCLIKPHVAIIAFFCLFIRMKACFRDSRITGS